MLKFVSSIGGRLSRFGLLYVALMLILLGGASLSNCQTPPPPKGDPSGAVTGAAADVIDAGGNHFVPQAPGDSDDAATKKTKQDALDAYNKQAKSEPLAVKLADAVGQTQIATNILWTLITGFLVMFMQAGFAMVEIGFCRAKNAAHIIMTNLMIYPVGALGFWIAGFGIMFGSLAASKLADRQRLVDSQRSMDRNSSLAISG